MKKDRSPPSVRLTVGQKWADAYIKISKGENIYAHSNKFTYGVCVTVGQTMLLLLFYKAPEWWLATWENKKKEELHAKAKLQ